MPDPLGISFMPGAQGDQGNNPQQTPVQQAIQTLSLRIPRVVGAGSLAPGQLLNAPGGAGLGGNPNSAALLEQIRRMLFGGGSVPGPGQFHPALPHLPGEPGGTPRVIPGEPPNAPREVAGPPTPEVPAPVPAPPPVAGPDPGRAPRERNL